MPYKRSISTPKGHFFLFGPRGTGKSTWLLSQFKPDLRIDLLQSKYFLELSTNPETLRQRVEALPAGSKIVIDEIQKLPHLLDEVHALIFDHKAKYQFAMSGSSARKLKRSHANMLAGRAARRDFFPLTSIELGEDFQIPHAMTWGTLPQLTHLETSVDKRDYLRSYAQTYLREEIQQEAVVRNIPGYSRFLKHAALYNGNVLNLNNISREVGIARSTVEGYFSILTDTLLGTIVEPIHLQAKVKEVSTPKFYFFDCGVVRALRGKLGPLTDEEKGQLFETLILNEIRAYSSYQSRGLEINYWGTPSENEVDFILSDGDTRIVVEVKASSQWKPSFSKGLKAVSVNKQIKARYGVYLGESILKIEGMTIFPFSDFCSRLNAGNLI